MISERHHRYFELFWFWKPRTRPQRWRVLVPLRRLWKLLLGRAVGTSSLRQQAVEQCRFAKDVSMCKAMDRLLIIFTCLRLWAKVFLSAYNNGQHWADCFPTLLDDFHSFGMLCRCLLDALPGAWYICRTCSTICEFPALQHPGCIVSVTIWNVWSHPLPREWHFNKKEQCSC